MKKILCALLGLILTLPIFAACPSGQVEQTYTSATGTVTQNGTPSPEHPVEPVFYTQGNMILRKINDTYYDSYDAATAKITRRVGVKVFNGEESGVGSDGIFINNTSGYIGLNKSLFPGIKMESPTVYSTHWQQGDYKSPSGAFCSVSGNSYFAWNKASTPDLTTQQSIKNWLIQQYANGTPVTVYYPLATETTEDWNETTYCATNVKIATTAYNSARFSPVVTELNDTIATIRSVVTNTINQTKAIADLQANKQTRPNETCPAGKKCLLVEDNDGQPHWYEIVESVLYTDYTQLEYIKSTGTQYIDTGIALSNDVSYLAKIGTTKGNVLGTTGIVWQVQSVFQIRYQGVSGQVDITEGFGKYTTDTLYDIGFNVNKTEFYKDNQSIAKTIDINSGQFIRTGMYDIIASLRIYNNNSIVRNFVPVKRNSDNVLGLYDLANDVFYTNAGTGTFTAGPEVQ